MTPQEEFAAKRAEAEQLIRQHAPQRLQDQLIALLRPAIALTATRTDDAQIPVGASKFGGAPDVPSDFVWPMWNDKPLGFLAQINLEEVAAFDVEGLLPKSGLLSFFLGVDALYDSQINRKWSVQWHQGELQRTRSVQRVNPSRISFSLQYSLPRADSLEMPYSLMNKQEADEFYDFKELHWYVLEPISRLFGHPRSIQQDVRLESNEAHRKRAPSSKSQPLEWLLLMCIDDEEQINIPWGDAGAIFFCIRQQDLAARKFDEIEFVFQCF